MRGGCKEFVTSIRGTLIDVFEDDDWCDLCGIVFVLIVCCGEVADQIELCGECIGCTRKWSSTKLKSCLCWNVGGRKGFALNSDDVRVGIVLTLE